MGQGCGGRHGPPCLDDQAPSVQQPLPALPASGWEIKSLEHFSRWERAAGSRLTIRALLIMGGAAPVPHPQLCSQGAQAGTGRPVTGPTGQGALQECSLAGAPALGTDSWGLCLSPATSAELGRGCGEVRPRPGLPSSPPGGQLVCFKPVGLGLLASGNRWWARVAILRPPRPPCPSRSHR